MQVVKYVLYEILNNKATKLRRYLIKFLIFLTAGINLVMKMQRILSGERILDVTL